MKPRQLTEIRRDHRERTKSIRSQKGGGTNEVCLFSLIANLPNAITEEAWSSQQKTLIDHYRERLAYYGHDPAQAVIGAGAGSLYLGIQTRKRSDAIARIMMPTTRRR